MNDFEKYFPFYVHHSNRSHPNIIYEMKIWCIENFGHQYIIGARDMYKYTLKWCYYGEYFYFKYEEDLITFKLKW